MPRLLAVLTALSLAAVLALPGASQAATTFSFAAPSGSPPGTGSDPQGVAIATLAPGGHPDLVVANSGSGNVSVFPGNGDGTFGSPTTLQTGTGSAPDAVAVADVNGDGRPDIVVAGTASGGGGEVWVFINNPANPGTFETAASYSVGVDPTGVAVGSLVASDKGDIVVADGGSQDVWVLLNNGDGTFQAAQGYSTGSADGPTDVALADVNGDGRLDAVTTDGNSDEVSVLLGNGNGTLQTASTFPTGAGTDPTALAIGAFTGGQPDIAVADDTSPGQVGILLNSSTSPGTFGSASDYPVGNGPDAIATADLNDDGNLDLVAANSTDGTASVLLGSGTGTFSTAITPAPSTGTGSNPAGVAIGDLNADGKPDFVTADEGTNQASVFLNTSVPAVTASSIPSFGSVLEGSKSSAEKVTVTNSGSAVLDISGITSSSTNFTPNGCSSTLAAGASCAVSVTFAPKSYGALTGTLSIVSNANGASTTTKVSLSGFGAAPVPTPQTLPPNSVTGLYATLNANVTSLGPGFFVFQYGTTTSYGQQTPALATTSSTLVEPESATIPVTPGAVYHYRIVVSNVEGTFYGADESFGTPPDQPRIGFGLRHASLAGVLRTGLPVLVGLDSPGLIKVNLWIKRSVAIARGVIGKHVGSGRLFELASGTVSVEQYTAQEVTLEVSAHAYRQLRRLRHLTVTVEATATSNNSFANTGDTSSRTIVLAARR